jgi:hypothetical protein
MPPLAPCVITVYIVPRTGVCGHVPNALPVCTHGQTRAAARNAGLFFAAVTLACAGPPGTCVIDGAYSRRGLVIVGPGTTTVTGFSIVRCLGTGDIGTSDGAGLYVSGTPAALIDVSVSHCSAMNAGGIMIAGAGAVVSFLRVTLAHNNAQSFAGGVYVFAGTLLATSVVVAHNSAAAGGGAAFTDGATVTLAAVLFANNVAAFASTQYGGGAFYAESSRVTGSNVTLLSNTATLSVGGGFVGAASSS